MRRTSGLIAVLTVISAALPRGPALAAEPLPSSCAGIHWGYAEQIASQGFLGALTPESDWRAVARAMGKLEGPDSHLEGVRQLDLSQFCEYLHVRGIRKVILVCEADSETYNRCDEVRRAKRGNLTSSCHGHDEDRLTATCFVARHTPGKSFDRHRAHAITPPTDSVSYTQDRHKDISLPSKRADTYRLALNASISSFVSDSNYAVLEALGYLSPDRPLGPPCRIPPNPLQVPDSLRQKWRRESSESR